MKVNVKDFNFVNERDATHSARDIHITLSNGAEFSIRERQDSPGMLEITVDGVLVIHPRSINAIRLIEDK